jgi:hypothetical protein
MDVLACSERVNGINRSAGKSELPLAVFNTATGRRRVLPAKQTGRVLARPVLLEIGPLRFRTHGFSD